MILLFNLTYMDTRSHSLKSFISNRFSFYHKINEISFIYKGKQKQQKGTK
jgi:hypothetical protein